MPPPNSISITPSVGSRSAAFATSRRRRRGTTVGLSMRTGSNVVDSLDSARNAPRRIE
jgi:hypothetical protein